MLIDLNLDQSITNDLAQGQLLNTSKLSPVKVAGRIPAQRAAHRPGHLAWGQIWPPRGRSRDPG